MPGGFDTAMEHICIDPFLDVFDYGRLVATSRFGAYTVSHGTAVAELRRQWGLELALFRICSHFFLDFIDFDILHASSPSVCDTVFAGLFGNAEEVAYSEGDSSMESETLR